MGDKRLNFNRPLLSVRRFSPAVGNAQKGSRRNNNNNGGATPGLLPSPSNRSDMHSGPLRNPGTVPFVWEQTPGKPKDETKTQKPLINPPPGRVLEPKEQGLCVEKGPTKGGFGRSEDCRKDSNDRPQITYGPNFLELNDDGDNDDEDDGEFEYDGNGNMPLKFCGLLPQFCLKGSIVMLNQTPGLSVRTRLPVSSANGTRVGASSAGSQDAKVAAYQPKSSIKNSKDLTVLNHEQGHGISANCNEPSPPPFILEEVEINTQKKGLISFQELLAYEIQKEKNFQNHTIEKTLYIDTIHKVESLKPEFKETDVNIFGISHIPTEQFSFDSVADNSNHDKEMITQTGVCNRSKIDQKVKLCQTVPDLPAPPPLPKSPSDSWLWRTLPSMNSKTASLRTQDSKRKLSSKTITKEGTNVQSQYPEGLLLPISET